jgi:acetyl/propionyl-CoA carboxylase alpha subunit
VKYIVDFGDNRTEVELDSGVATVESYSIPASLLEIEGTPVCLASLADETHRVVVRRGGRRGSYTIWIGGYRFVVEALDERARAIRDITARGRAPSGPAPVVAPMPGLIVRVNVKAGDQVTAGQGVIVMEAMKMENELRAAAAGRVRSVLIEPGTPVEKGALLIELE